MQIQGDANFIALVNAALVVVDRAHWRWYLDWNLSIVRQAAHNEWAGQVAWVKPDPNDTARGIASFDMEGRPQCNANWLATELIHEASHGDIAHAGQKSNGRYGEAVADWITSLFSRMSQGYIQTLRKPWEIEEAPGASARGRCQITGRFWCKLGG